MISSDLQKRIDDLRLISKQHKINLSFEDIGEDLVMVQNQRNLKAAILGQLEINGSELCVAYLINMKKWAWAIAEGFEMDDIVSDDRLKKEIFIFTPLDELILKLV